jgi:hypothetical protein
MTSQGYSPMANRVVQVLSFRPAVCVVSGKIDGHELRSCMSLQYKQTYKVSLCSNRLCLIHIVVRIMKLSAVHY